MTAKKNEMGTKVVHVRDCPDGWKEDDRYVYIGRPSKWGNPFKIGPHQTRSDVIFQYEQSLSEQKKQDCRNELRGKILVCYCNPKPCHGDVLAQIADLDDYDWTDSYERFLDRMIG